MPDDLRHLVDALQTVPQEAGVPKPDPILVVDGVRRHFGGLTAVDVDHVEIQRGTITALIGPNGAGQWTFEGRQLAGVRPHKVAQYGMVRTFQLTKALSRLTVMENMRLGAQDQRGEKLFASIFPFLWRKQEDEISERALSLLASFNLDQKRDDMAGSLSGGQRKLLEMARALMVEPEMVMLDEPMAGVNPALTQSLLDHIRQVRDRGTTVLFVEHDMDMVRDISDWVVVMSQGRVIAEGPPHDVMSNEAVIDAYL